MEPDSMTAEELEHEISRLERALAAAKAAYARKLDAIERKRGEAFAAKAARG